MNRDGSADVKNNLNQILEKIRQSQSQTELEKIVRLLFLLCFLFTKLT